MVLFIIAALVLALTVLILIGCWCARGEAVPEPGLEQVYEGKEDAKGIGKGAQVV